MKSEKISLKFLLLPVKRGKKLSSQTILLSSLCFFFFAFYRGIGGEIGQDGDFMIFEGSRYRGGFMYKTLAMSAIVSACTKLMM